MKIDIFIKEVKNVREKREQRISSLLKLRQIELIIDQFEFLIACDFNLKSLLCFELVFDLGVYTIIVDLVKI